MTAVRWNWPEGKDGNMLQLWFVANTLLWPLFIDVGGFQLGLNVIVLGLAGTVWLAMNRKIAASSAGVMLALLAYLIFSLAVSVTGPCNDKLLKSMITLPILMVLVLIGLEAGRRAGESDWLNLQSAAVWTLLAAFSAFILEMALPSLFPLQAMYRNEGKFSGLYHEPSHVAFSLFPCVAILLVAESKKTRRSGILALLGLLVFSRSSTLLVFIAVWVLYRLLIRRRLGHAVLTALGIATLIVLGSAINYDALVAPIVSRIVGVAASTETDNISSLVYVQGWQDASANFTRTHGLGLGFNMMGCHPLPDVLARRALAIAGLEELNATDGSFLFGKMVSEAGFGGILFYIAITVWWIRLEKRIPLYAEDADRLAATAQAALIFCFLASSFIRSGSYFNGGFLICLAAVSGASKRWQNHLTKPAGNQSDLQGLGRGLPGAAGCA